MRGPRLGVPGPGQQQGAGQQAGAGVQGGGDPLREHGPRGGHLQGHLPPVQHRGGGGLVLSNQGYDKPIGYHAAISCHGQMLHNESHIIV